MNMKNLLRYLAVFVFSFNAFAVDVQEEPKGVMPDTYLATHIVNSHTIPQASAEKPSEFITALGVYLIIIIVYSIYGVKANSKNAKTEH